MKLWRENDDIRILKASQERNIYDIMSSINQSTVQSVQNNESKILKENKRTINNSNSLVSSSTNQSNINKQVLQYKKKGNNTNNIGNTTTSSFNKPINQNVKQGKVLDKKQSVVRTVFLPSEDQYETIREIEDNRIKVDKQRIE